MRKVKKGDDVIVIAGKDKGKRGTVARLIGPDRLIIENINIIKRHVKPNPARGISGGIVEKEAALHISNIALFNPVTKKADRVGFRILADGRKVRFFKSNNEVVDV